MIIGSIIGAIAGVEAQNHEMAYSAGYAASTAFFQQYGRIVFAFHAAFTALLSFFGILPGTGRFKRKKNA
ncbi:MAG TPA: hypothetical protein ENN23_00830 [Deltaproteobacteria bacterium]|nr:hypothetical protein [Deltaproteobacteria bacterium]